MVLTHGIPITILFSSYKSDFFGMVSTD